jgi:cell wall-associated NlpC family hydrolase
LITPDQVVAAARSWLRTPWHHQARSRAGIDCAGLIVMVGRELGLFDPALDYKRYGRSPIGKLEQILDQHFVKLPALEPGAVIAITWWEDAQHLGIVADHYGRQMVVHSSLVHHEVVENGIDEQLKEQIVPIHGYPGVRYRGLS